jgi:hypothetical protein
MGDQEQQFEKEKTKIVNDFLSGLLLFARNLTRIRLSLSRKDIASASTLEDEIESLISSYRTRETAFCYRLVALYKEYNKPHPLTLEDAIAEKESELKKYIGEVKTGANNLFKKLEDESVNPLLLVNFLDWYKTADYEGLSREYKEIAKGKSLGEIESRLRANLLKALAKVIDV